MPNNDGAKGALFKNKEKQGMQPDYTGNIDMPADVLKAWLAEGAGGPCKVRIAAWIKQGQGGPFLSLNLNSPFKKGAPAAASAPASRRPVADDDIPF